jgi:hypothetical protein
MRHRSLKTQRVYVHRRKLVAEQLAAVPICQRCHQQTACDVHELVSRGRGGSILDQGNVKSLCRDCHDLITTHPDLAAAEGWALSKGALRHLFLPDDIGYCCSVCNLPAMNWRHRQDAA